MATRGKNGKEQKPKRFMEELPVKLSGVEISDRRERLQDLELRIDALEAERSRTLEGLNDRKTQLVLERKELLATLSSGKEKRPVECIEEADIGSNTAKVVRLDTREIVRERAIEAEERAKLAQGDLIDDEHATPESRT